MLMVLAKLEELKIPFDVTAVISDFELDIVKSVDEMLEVDVVGRFFHFTSCLKNKGDKKLPKTLKFTSLPKLLSYQCKWV